MLAYEVFSWSVLILIVLAASLLRFIDTVRILKTMTDFASVTAIAYFYLLMSMKRVSRESKSRSPRWLSIAQAFAIPQGR